MNTWRKFFLRARKQRTEDSTGFLAPILFLLGTLPLLTESSRKLPAAEQWVDADRSNMKPMVIDTILLKERSTGILWPVLFILLPSVPMHRQQEAVGSFELQAVHRLDKIHSSLSCSFIQSSICCPILAFVSGLFLEGPGPQVGQPCSPQLQGEPWQSEAGPFSVCIS